MRARSVAQKVFFGAWVPYVIISLAGQSGPYEVLMFGGACSSSARAVNVIEK